MKGTFALALLTICMMGCGGGGGSVSQQPSQPSTPTPVNIQGQWQVVAHSQINPQSYIALGTNLIQTQSSVNATSSDVVSVVLYDPSNMGWQFGAACGGGQLGTYSLSGTVAQGTQLSFVLTESGVDGNNTITGMGTISSDGNAMTGTYTAPAGCGVPADSGTFSASRVNLSGTYNFAESFGGVSEGTVTVTESTSGNTLSVTGTVQAYPVSLTGTYSGNMFSLSGIFAGSSVSYIGALVPPGLGNFSGYVLLIDPNTDALLGVLTKR
jgi:hypothetical protein